MDNLHPPQTAEQKAFLNECGKYYQTRNNDFWQVSVLMNQQDILTGAIQTTPHIMLSVR